jgi:hypothetical protein
MTCTSGTPCPSGTLVCPRGPAATMEGHWLAPKSFRSGVAPDRRRKPKVTFRNVRCARPASRTRSTTCPASCPCSFIPDSDTLGRHYKCRWPGDDEQGRVKLRCEKATVGAVEYGELPRFRKLSAVGGPQTAVRGAVNETISDGRERVLFGVSAVTHGTTLVPRKLCRSSISARVYGRRRAGTVRPRSGTVASVSAG